MADKKVKLVTSYKTDDGQTMYEFRCPYPTGCGENALDPDATPYRAFNLADREWAVARGKQHLAEHESTADPNRDNELTPEMHEFRVALGIAAAAAPTVNPDDWEL